MLPGALFESLADAEVGVVVVEAVLAVVLVLPCLLVGGHAPVPHVAYEAVVLPLLRGRSYVAVVNPVLAAFGQVHEVVAGVGGILRGDAVNPVGEVVVVVHVGHGAAQHMLSVLLHEEIAHGHGFGRGVGVHQRVEVHFGRGLGGGGEVQRHLGGEPRRAYHCHCALGHAQRVVGAGSESHAHFHDATVFFVDGCRHCSVVQSDVHKRVQRYGLGVGEHDFVYARLHRLAFGHRQLGSADFVGLVLHGVVFVIFTACEGRSHGC